MAQLLFGAGDATTFGTTDTATSSTAVLNGSLITNAVVGDLIVVAVHNSLSTPLSITAPSASGWTAVGAALGAPDSGTSRTTGVYYYAITSSSVLTAFQASHTWTFGGGARVACVAARATGIDLNSPVDVAASAFTNGSPIAGITTTGAALVVCEIHRQAASPNAPNLTALGSMTFLERRTSSLTTGSSSAVALGYVSQGSAGATGTVAATYSATTAAIGGQLIAFKAGTWTPPAPTGIAVKYTSATDTLATGHLFFTSATDTLATPGEVRRFPTGYSSVTAMLAGASTSTPFYVAHRGGDLNWPEMSLYAYTQAAYWGVRALEVSLARTSDGVWFGMHDDTLDRTSGVTGVTASAVTWATIQSTYQISAGLPSGQTAKPYMRVEEIVAAYGSSHVLFVDPKVAIANVSELLTLLSSLYGGDTNLAARVILKYYGVSGMTIPDAAAARGMKTWGYFYGTDSANYTTYAGRWDILGQDYNATAQNWTDLAAAGPGKPIIGHLCPTSSAVTTCTSRGAVGAMVSGVTAAITRTP